MKERTWIAFSNSTLLTIFSHSLSFSFASLSVGARFTTTLKSASASLNFDKAMFAIARR